MENSAALSLGNALQFPQSPTVSGKCSASVGFARGRTRKGRSAAPSRMTLRQAKLATRQAAMRPRASRCCPPPSWSNHAHQRREAMKPVFSGSPKI